MRHSARYLLLLSCLLIIAGCGKIGQASAPPLIFPTAQQETAAGPAPLSLYFSLSTLNNTGQNTIFAIDALTGHLRWHFDSQAPIQSGPLLQNDTVYFSASNQTIYALNAGNGTVRWHYTTNGVASVQLVDNGIVYAGSDSSNTSRTPTTIYALNTADGSLRWKAPITGAVSGVADTTVYINSAKGDLYALNTSNGSQRWTFNSGSKTTLLQTTNGITYALSSLPGNFQGTSILYALNSADGTVTWRYPQANSTSGILPLTIQTNTVYVSANDNGSYGLNTIYALNSTDGSERWHNEVSVNATIFTGWLAETTLYLGANDSTVYALNAATGATRWQKRIGSNSANIQLVDQGVLYVSLLNEGLIAVSASNSTILWRYKITGGFIFTPQLINGQLYGAYTDPNNPAGQAYLFSMNTKDGTLKWRYNAAAGLVFPVIG
jgi:outer membrane protein assembly factor BamB